MQGIHCLLRVTMDNFLDMPEGIVDGGIDQLLLSDRCPAKYVRDDLRTGRGPPYTYAQAQKLPSSKLFSDIGHTVMTAVAPAPL